MRLGELKPKGSGKTFNEWFEICKDTGTACIECVHMTECRSVTDGAFYRNIYMDEIEPFLNVEVEVD